MHGGASSFATDEGILISGNVISNTRLNAVNISNHSNVRIDDNIINDADKGIFISSSSPGAINVSIANNTINNTKKEGIGVYFALQLEIMNNIIKNYNLEQKQRPGIYINAGKDIISANNVFKYGGKIETIAILSYAKNVGLYNNLLQYSAKLPLPFSNLGNNPKF